MSNGKIIKFEQPAEFFYNTAQKMMDGGAYINALSSIRRAVELNPQNYEFSLCLAEVLTELNKYEESNRVLFEILEKQIEVDADCFFCLGCNFMGMNDVEKAKESFEKYLQVDPDGEYCEEVEDFLFYFETESEAIHELFSDENDDAYSKASRGKRYLDEGKYEDAAKILESIHENDDAFSYAKNNLALAYYCLKRPKEAIKVTERVLRKNKNNIHANCNMAIFKNEMEGDYAGKKYIERAVAANPTTMEDIYKIAITMCELHMHEEAIRFLRELTEHSPYDEKVLFYLATALHNTGKPKEAITLLHDIKKLDYPGVIADYFIRYINHEIIYPEDYADMEYIYQVPTKEAKRKIKYLNDCLKLPDQEFHSLWNTSDEFLHTVLWGLEYGDDNIKRAIAGMIAGFADEKAERMLREFLLNKKHGDDVKNDVFILLKRMNAKEPYVAYIDNDVVEVKVGAYDSAGNDLSDDFAKLFKLLYDIVDECYPEEVLKTMLEVVQRYISVETNALLPDLINEIGAAILVVALEESGYPAEIGVMSKKTGADPQIVADYVCLLRKSEQK